ncbi:hypothetical protein F5Y11DRAFT_342142 [Daldinia sp. FL1419]|nr:hypothetical protein F5Y11DRAFT_342142 [Daldinia sp. FL1419]
MPESTPAQILCGTQGSAQDQCRQVHIELPNQSELPKPLRDWPDIRGLNQLQASRDEWLNGDAIDKAVKIYYDSLPQLAREKIHIADTSIEGIFGDSERAFEDVLARNYRRFFRGFKNTEYVLWPINVRGNHWELCLIRKQNPSGAVDGWTSVVRVSIIDSWEDSRRGPRKLFVEDRLQKLLLKQNLTFAIDWRKEVSTARQPDSWSCGLRTFWAARQAMDRIVNMVRTGTYRYNENLWNDMGGWFNPDLVRWEMIGLNAYQAVKEMDYRARVAVELVNHTRDAIDQLDAAAVMRPPRGGDSTTVYIRGRHKRTREDDEETEQPPATRRRTEAGAVPGEQRVAPGYSVAEGDYEPHSQRHNNPVFPPAEPSGPPPNPERYQAGSPANNVIPAELIPSPSPKKHQRGNRGSKLFGEDATTDFNPRSESDKGKEKERPRTRGRGRGRGGRGGRGARP